LAKVNAPPQIDSGGYGSRIALRLSGTTRIRMR
jgi:hypothetical protein